MTRASSTILLLCLFSIRPVEAQEPHLDAITGEVRTSTGAPVPAPIVRVTATGTSDTRAAQTFANGRFVLVWVDGRGDYTVSISAPGFQRVTRHVHRTGSNPHIDLHVELRSASSRDTRKDAAPVPPSRSSPEPSLETGFR
ncbi:MAG: carboxypeptidase-like regulatory domain-containing protein [Gemmatimonadota bacterium]|nr:carboxypeptidase-like regulatory domain-containing protein [Gemmatimonadota bacterium]